MPPLMIGSILVTAAAAVAAPTLSAAICCAIACAALALGLTVTLTVHSPLNSQFVSWSHTTPPSHWARRFACWDRWDTIRWSIVSKAFLLAALALAQARP